VTQEEVQRMYLLHTLKILLNGPRHEPDFRI